jgi:Zn-finger nucleic acid-binding protein
VWLDRGELDKIIERSAAPAQPQARQDYREPPRHTDSHGYPKKKKGGLLGELFDF